MIVLDSVSREFVAKTPSKANKVIRELKNAIDDLTFHIPKGEIVGIVGSNGAGKSTLIKLITGLLTPTTGLVRTNGLDPIKNSKKLLPKISVIFGTHTNLIEEATVYESFLLTKAMYKISKEEYERKFTFLRELLDLDNMLLKTVRELSFGEIRRATIAMNLLPDMELIILDEALVGIDATKKNEIFQYLKKLNEEKRVTIVITSHNLEDIKAICHRVLILHKGKKLYYGNIDHLLKQYANHVMIKCTLKDRIPDLEDLAIERYMIKEKVMTIYYDRNIISEKTILSCILNKCEVSDIKVLEPCLEDALLTILTGGISWKNN